MQSRSSNAPSIPWARIAAYGFLLNMLWEFGQCGFLYDMWDWGFWRGSAWMWGAIIGDVGIVLGVTTLARFGVADTALTSMNSRGWTALLAVGFVAGVLLEWLAKVLGLWAYTELMPTITLFEHTVGLSPIVQITVLPALSVAVATRNRD
jgi:hypothetical protein